jgi:hypothetical protein
MKASLCCQLGCAQGWNKPIVTNCTTAWPACIRFFNSKVGGRTPHRLALHNSVESPRPPVAELHWCGVPDPYFRRCIRFTRPAQLRCPSKLGCCENKCLVIFNACWCLHPVWMCLLFPHWIWVPHSLHCTHTSKHAVVHACRTEKDPRMHIQWRSTSSLTHVGVLHNLTPLQPRSLLLLHC